MRNTFVNLLLTAARNDNRIMLLTGDLGYGVVDNFAKDLPKQFVNFGINEQTMMSAAAGLASQGYKPFVYSIGNFPTFRCLEQIRNDVCYMDLDVTIVALGAGFAYGTAGYSHHLIEDIGAVSSLHNIQVFSPADENETEMVVTEVISSIGPKYVRLGKGGEGIVTKEFNTDNPGFSIYPGDENVLILSTGNIVTEAILARGLFENKLPTIASCYNFSHLPRFLNDSDFERIVTLEEHVLRGGFGSMVREIVGNNQTLITNIAIKRIDTQISGSQKYLRERYGLTARTISQSL